MQNYTFFGIKMLPRRGNDSSLVSIENPQFNWTESNANGFWFIHTEHDANTQRTPSRKWGWAEFLLYFPYKRYTPSIGWA